MYTVPVVRFSFNILLDLCQTCHQAALQFPDFIQLSGKLLYELYSIDEVICKSLLLQHTTKFLPLNCIPHS